MKKIIVLSDTHRNQSFLRKVFSIEEELSHIFHLGDDYEDLDENPDLTEGKEVIKVPGIYHKGYLKKTIPFTQKVEIDGWSFLLIHAFEDLKRTNEKAEFILFGHTHIQHFHEDGNNYYINPGHLKRAFDKGRPASYLIIELEESKIRLLFKSVSGEIMFTEKIEKI